MVIILNAIKIIFLLGFLVLIHEGGHFLTAKFFKVKVNEFSVGFGPAIFSKKYKDTKYSLRLIPFGGFVDMLGEAERKDEQGSFSNAKVLHRIAIVAAGAIVNIIFALIVYFVLVFNTGINISTTVGEIIPEYAENLKSLEVGDKILEMDGEKVRLKKDIDKILKNVDSNKNLIVLVERNGENRYITITPSKYEDTDSYILGIKVALSENTVKDKLYYSFWETIDFSFSAIDSLKMLVLGEVTPKQMMGPIGISEVVVKTSDIYNYVYILAVVSLSLGVTNLLPIPALDGGKIVLLIIEAIRRKPLKEEVEFKIQEIGFIFIMMLALYVSYNDITRIF